jgi:hypothetical protein
METSLTELENNYNLSSMPQGGERVPYSLTAKEGCRQTQPHQVITYFYMVAPAKKTQQLLGFFYLGGESVFRKSY